MVNGNGDILLYFNVKCADLKLTKNHILILKKDQEENIFLGAISRRGSDGDDLSRLNEILSRQP
jgi:hypothetical protein